MKVGINYISSIPNELTEKLVSSNLIHVFKFPGNRCNKQELQGFMENMPPKAVADIHGLISFVPAWNEKNILESIDKQINREIFIKTKSTYFSTHIGRFNEDGDAIQNFEENLMEMRKMFPNIRMGGENVFSLVDIMGKANYMTIESSSPEFINKMWNKLDFGVFDLSHAVLASRDHGVSFENYVKALNKEKVEILHISRICPQKDELDDDKADPHTPCGIYEFEKLIHILPDFPKLQLIVSEIAYSEKNGERIEIKTADYLREAQLLNLAITTRNIQLLKKFF